MRKYNHDRPATCRAWCVYGDVFYIGKRALDTITSEIFAEEAAGNSTKDVCNASLWENQLKPF